MSVNTLIMCVAQCWITREKKEEFHRLYPTHGMLSRVIEAAIDKAIADKKQQLIEKENQNGSGHVKTGSVTSKVPKARARKNA